MRRHDWTTIRTAASYRREVARQASVRTEGDTWVERCEMCGRRRLLSLTLNTRRTVALTESGSETDWRPGATCGPCAGGRFAWPAGRPISRAPKDRLILTWSPARDGLDELFALCQWHPDGGFCVDELRSPTVYWELPGGVA